MGFEKNSRDKTMNKVKVTLSVIISLIFVNIALADVPAPPVAQEIQIELARNYPDYQFYLCSYQIEVKPNPNPPHPSRPDMVVSVPGSFEQKAIDLSPDKPFSQPVTSHIRYRSDKLSERVYWLAAIKKSQTPQLEAKIKEAVLNSIRTDGIRLARLEDTLPAGGDQSKGAKTVVNKVSLDEKEMKLTVEEGASNVKSGITCFGIGLFLTGLALLGGWWTKKRSI
jgi:hypothetical protein